MYCLTDFVDYANLQEPLKHSSRIKYTCFDVSANLIVLGSSAGSLYIFNETGKFLHLIPNGNGAVTKVQISPNEKYVAFSQRSVVCLYVINLSAHATPQVIVTHLKSNQQVTCLRWTKDCKHFFCGDTFGQVNLVMLSSFIGSNLLLNMTLHPLLILETPIVQLDDFETLLLVSTQNKCILCNTDYEEYKQIGNKPRTGAFGACFWISNDETTRPSRIYCARPGTRFWETDFEGDVLRTHQFKSALAMAPSKIHKAQTDEEDNLSRYEENDELLDYSAQNLQFEKIQMLDQGFLLAYTEFGLYIFDMVTSSVVLWCNQFERINDCKVFGDKITIFTQTGSLYGVRLQTTDSLACTLVLQERLLESACLMRKNVKYFADKAREDYDLRILNRIKNFLIDRQEYEILNDLSVIFDAIAQCEGNGDNQSSGGSSTTAERSISAAPPLPLQPTLNAQSKSSSSSSSNGVYVLENAFCDNSKQQRNSERHLKDALLTVTGKFGKNIIKYKFNIFAEEQQKLVQELLPTNERSMPFKDINAFEENEEVEIACRSRKSMSMSLSSSSSTANTTITATAGAAGKSATNNTSVIDLASSHISAEEKTIYNLYLICKSSQIGNTKFVERYRSLFDEYTARELIDLLHKLEKLMIEHGDDSSDKARKYCFEMYFNYLNTELIWEVDDEIRDYITEGFILLNSNDDIERCENCQFPLRFDNSCSFYELGAVLLRYYWSRNEQIKCFDILNAVPALFDILAKFYMVEGNLKKVLPILISYGKPELLQDLGKNLNISAWMQLFEFFKDVHYGRLACVNCEHIATVDNINRHFFYTWNCFLNIALENLSSDEILNLVYKWSSYIPNDALDREFYIKCLLK